MKVRVSIVTPTIGTPALTAAVCSVASQTVPVRHVVVVDGAAHEPAVRAAIAAAGLPPDRAPTIVVLPDRTGGDGHYGHRIYAHVAPLLTADHVGLLDEDNSFESDHVASLIPIAAVHGAGWSLRRMVSTAGEDLGVDRIESIGRQVAGPDGPYRLVDTSCWLLRQDLVPVLAAMDGRWGGDRRLVAAVADRLGDPATLGSGRATLRYTLRDDLVAAFRAASGQTTRAT